jgi:CxxC-x17-CxxC domain-containing protein
MENEIIILGETTFRNQRKKFGIKLDDRRRHIYVIGKTGMGKTVLLENMAIQDILAGRGVGFIDPHGEAAEELLNYIPKNRINDVVYFNPADIEFPIAFNAMEKVSQEHRHLIASGLMGVFKKIWPDVWSARMEYILNNTILALLEYPNSTLLSVNRMLSDSDYRKKVVERITDPVVKSFWTNEFSKYTQSYEVEATAAIQNKVGQFVANPLIRNIIGQVKSKIEMRKIMDEGKILIANLSKGKIGEDNSRLLGALLITKLQLAAMSRVDIPEERRRDFFLYVDEFQNFATEAFCNILSEARKYRLSLILANQYIAQLEEMTPLGKSTKVRDAIFGNVGTIIVFRVGAEDGEFLEKEFQPEFSAEDLINLEKYNICIKLMIDGITSSPFSAITLPLKEKPQKSYKDTIIRASRERYGTERKIIEGKIEKWAETVKQISLTPKPVLYDAQCSVCGKKIKVPFQPDSSRSVYCQSCSKKVEKEKEKEITLSSLPPRTTKPKEKKEIKVDEIKKVLEKILKKNEEDK